MISDKNIIWSDIDLDFDEWKEDLKSEYPEMNDDQLYNLMYEINGGYLEDERINLDIQLSKPIIIIADLGLWNGRKSGYKMIDSGNIKDCLYSDCDSNEWYVDQKGDLRCTAIHHDGTNHYLYRVIKDKATENQVNKLLNLIYFDKATRSDIVRVTNRLGDDIGKVYGWEFDKRSSKRDMAR